VLQISLSLILDYGYDTYDNQSKTANHKHCSGQGALASVEKSNQQQQHPETEPKETVLPRHGCHWRSLRKMPLTRIVGGGERQMDF
jgi:hypothetical protein